MLEQTSQLSDVLLELLLFAVIAAGIFLFFRACWHNIHQREE